MKNAIALKLYFLQDGLARGYRLPVRGEVRDRAALHGGVDAEGDDASADAVFDGGEGSRALGEGLHETASHDDVTAAVAIPGPSVNRLDLLRVADTAVLDDTGVGVSAEGALGAAEEEPTFGDAGVAVRMEGRADVVAVLNDSDLVVHDVGAFGEGAHLMRVRPALVGGIAIFIEAELGGE